VNTGASGACKVVTWKNVRFDQYPSPAVALTRTEVVKEVKTITSFPSWAVNNTESQHHLKPVLCDNGDIYATVMFTSNNFSLYKLTRGATGEANKWELSHGGISGRTATQFVNYIMANN
jgi:hypothetical protein